jgi:hypothetical protein
MSTLVSPLDIAVARQLIAPPAASVALLDAIDAGATPPPYGPGEADAVDLVRMWCATLFQRAYLPPPGTAFAAFPKEHGGCDAVRGRWIATVDGDPPERTPIELASTSAVESITVTPSPEERALPSLERAARITARILAKPLDLVEHGASGTLVYGAPRGPLTRKFPQWDQDLRWWCTPEKVGVVFLRGHGGPTRQAIGWAVLYNEVWFKLYR